MYSFPCPHCSTPLRIRDDHRSVGAIDCPSCATPLTIQELNGQVTAELKDVQVDLNPKFVNSPIRFRTLFAIIGSLVACVVVFSLVQARSKSNSISPVSEEVTHIEKADSIRSEESPPVKNSLPEEETLEQRLQNIYRLVIDSTQQDGIVPNGKFSESNSKDPQHSWIAEVMAKQQVGGVSLVVDQPWNDPVNDAFVRRRIALFQNPEIQKIVGADRYPASHFAGVAGVGDDAERLPKRHPRAGIFSPYRETYLADILDGTTNTIMLVGVNSQLGSWARPGSATLRSFTREPYLNGPDGMGTGQAGSMLVLMADGSVRTVASETSPIIARRMAAMADGLPLNLETPGDPLVMQLSTNITTAEVEAPGAGIDDSLIEPILAPDLPLLDVKKSLGQRLRTYRLEQPKQLKLLLIEFQELLGAPVDWSQLEDEVLKQEIQLSLEDVTLLELLQELTEETKLEYSVEQSRIVLKQIEIE